MAISKKLLTIQILITIVTYAFPVLLPKGIHAWTSAWIFLFLWFAFWFFMLIWLYIKNPELFKERMRIQTSDQKGWDKLLGPLVYVSLLIWLLFTSYDAGYFHWSFVPVWLQVIGIIILLFALYIFYMTFWVNTFLSPLVRIQQDRGQTVISSGPYKHIRHPMYSATLIVIVGSSLLIGSLYGIIIGLIFVGFILGYRSILEEQTMKKELPGYVDYMVKVKYRLIPYIW